VTTPGRHAAIRVLAVVVASIGGFLLLEQPVRRLEASAAGWLLQTAGADNLFVFGPSVQVFPAGYEPFRAVVAPSCSSLTSLLALVCLASLAPKRPRLRRYGALLAALATVAVGNLLRITGSIAVGLVAGPSSLILFHDWVGSIFTFVYTLGGYVLMLYLLLPPRSRVRSAPLVATG
jgi:exosortase/archaeosortase family protein